MSICRSMEVEKMEGPRTEHQCAIALDPEGCGAADLLLVVCYELLVAGWATSER